MMGEAQTPGPARWERVEALLDGALDLEPGRRADYLARACGPDAELRAEVERLLRACETAGPFLEQPAALYAGPLLDPDALHPAEPLAPAAPAPGARIGPYRLVRELGRGGMGAVFLAERDDGHFHKLVALKLIRPDNPAGALIVRRFHAERQILAWLEHPNLARLLDGGATPEGLPYFVMEYVPGVPIDRFCAERRLPLEQRLRLFLALCDAVDYAHRQSVLHRDLKPSNVLVTGEGVVKLLDFGIAKLAGAEAATALTRAELRPLTPRYASPEQLRGEPATVASDVYALGIILHELVTGRHPADAPAGSARPGGALGAILGRALGMEPQARYGSAAELAADVRGHLEGRRVGSAGAGWWARAGRLARRPAARVGTGALALGLLLGAGVWLRGPRGEAHGHGAPALGAAPAPASPTVAILPLVNLTRDREQEYFSDGLTGELLDALAQLPGLHVAARTSAFAFKGRAVPVPEIGRELRVSHIVEGSVQRSGDRVRITVQLVDARTGYEVWSGRYDRRLHDIFALEDEIGRSVVRALAPRLAAAGGPPLVRAGTRSPEAHELYLKGQFYLGRRTGEGLRRALGYFQRALALDPGYAAAYAGIGHVYSWLADAYLPPDAAYPRAEQALGRALALDETLADAHDELGWVRIFYHRDWAGGAAEFRRVRELDPDASDFLYLALRGHVAEAIPEAERALVLDPLSASLTDQTAWVYVFARQYDRAIRRARETLELDPDFYYGDSPLAAAYLGLGRWDDAIAVYRRVRQRGDESAAGWLAIAYARAGRGREARRALADLLAYARGHHVMPEEIAAVYAWLGERDRAFAWLEQGFVSHSAGVVYLRVAPWFDPLRADPRFARLLARAGLADDAGKPAPATSPS